MNRKGGEVQELPEKEHMITRIEAPSETVRTSDVNKLEQHPSLFFQKMEEKDVNKVFKDRASQQNPARVTEAASVKRFSAI